jgi:ferredoxin
MRIGERRVLLCDCEGTMPLAGEALARALGGVAPAQPCHQLCRGQLDVLRKALEDGAPLLVACQQEAATFTEEAAAVAGADLRLVDIRDRAGWSGEAAAALPKMAALLAEAAVEVPPAPAVTMRSSGRCLVYGPDEAALAAARQLAGRLSPVALCSEVTGMLPPRLRDVPVAAGRIRRLEGHLGTWRVLVDGYAQDVPSARDGLRFGPPRDGVELEVDLVLDLSGGPPLLSGGARRDGYLRPDPANPAAVQRALFDLVDLVGEFEKPQYINFTASLCAHSRSGRVGCTRCLDQCPTGAIAPDGDHVRIDPHICAGCGACAAVCPTGAATYAAPPPNTLLERLRVLLSTYLEAGGTRPIVLLHEARHGEELIAALARAGDGLPAAVLPVAVGEVAQLGLETLAGAMAYGAAMLVVLVPPTKHDEVAGVRANLEVLEVVLRAQGFDGERLRLVEEGDPLALGEVLRALAPEPGPEPGAFLPMGGKRALMRLALERLHVAAPTPVDVVALPQGAPFGRVVVDLEGCTLCLACVGACPTGALLDHPDRPTLRFVEEACVQCGLCRSTCPERVIRLEPRLDLTPAAREPLVLKEEEPFCCVRCGKPFGTRSSVERIVAALAEKHWMYQRPEQIERIRMCDDCRIIAQLEAGDDPFRMAERPRPRTTDDYLREREEIEAARRKLAAQRGEGEG